MPNTFDWKSIYLLQILVTQDFHLRAFQYKILNNILYLNKKLFQFTKAKIRLCYFFKNSEETAMRFFNNFEDVTNVLTKVR